MHDSPRRPAALDYSERAAWLQHDADREIEPHVRLAAELTRDDHALLVDVGCGAAGVALAPGQSRPARVLLDSGGPRRPRVRSGLRHLEAQVIHIGRNAAEES